MRPLITVTLLAAFAGLGGAFALKAEPVFNPANAISLEDDHPSSFRNFAPELPAMRARAPQINTDFGLHVSQIEPGLHFVTDMIYQSAFLVTDAGVVVFDAPPSFGDRLLAAIDMTAPGVPITHLIMSHAHSDHNGGGHLLAGIDGLSVIAARANAASIETRMPPGVPTPTRSFDDSLSLVIGGVPIELTTAHFHAEDVDTVIHLPQQRFLMAVDTITPGEAPFMNFGATSDLGGYLDTFQMFLDHDFDHFLSGHVSVPGTRDDVIAARDYAFDVFDTVAGLMPGFMPAMMQGMEAVSFQHGNLAYRYAIEQVRDACADQIIERWETTLSVVDLWADSHCETAVLYQIMH